MVLWLALFAVICDVLEVLSEYAHAHTDIVLPDAAAFAANPGLVLSIAVLAGGAADAADELVLLGLGLRLGLLLGRLLAAALGLEGCVEGIEGLVLALGAPHRAAGLWFGHGVPLWRGGDPVVGAVIARCRMCGGAGLGGAALVVAEGQ